MILENETDSKMKHSNFLHLVLIGLLLILLYFLPMLGVSESFAFILFFIGMIGMHLQHGGKQHGNHKEE